METKLWLQEENIIWKYFNFINLLSAGRTDKIFCYEQPSLERAAIFYLHNNNLRLEERLGEWEMLNSHGDNSLLGLQLW